MTGNRHAVDGDDLQRVAASARARCLPRAGPPRRSATPTRSASVPTRTGTRAPPARACRPCRSGRPGARTGACGCPGRAALVLELLLGLEQHLPDRRRGRKERVLALGPEDRRVLQRHPAVEDRLRIDQRRTGAGRSDLEEHVRFVSPPRCWRRRPSRSCRRDAEHGPGEHLHARAQRVQIDVIGPAVNSRTFARGFFGSAGGVDAGAGTGAGAPGAIRAPPPLPAPVPRRSRLRTAASAAARPRVAGPLGRRFARTPARRAIRALTAVCSWGSSTG